MSATLVLQPTYQCGPLHWGTGYYYHKILLIHLLLIYLGGAKGFACATCLPFSQNMWYSKAAQIKGDKQFSWHLNDIYQNAFKHTKIFIGISRPFKESL